MAVCRACGMALQPTNRRCPKCGLSLVSRSEEKQKDAPLDKAVQELIAPPASAPPPSSVPVGRIVLVALAVLLIAGLGWLAVLFHHASEAEPYLPLVAGKTWDFQDAKDASYKVHAVLQAQSSVEGHNVWTAALNDGSMGNAYFSRGLFDFDLTGFSGAYGTHWPSVPLVKFPMAGGRTWEWEWRESFGTLAYTGSFSVVSASESVTVPAGTYDTVHIRTMMGQRVTGVQIQLDYWLARGVGPVRFDLQAPNGAFGLNARQLELTKAGP